MQRGFSLVELSIVLVILGLLTGGILAGQSLIRAAELRSVTTESQRYITAVQAFRDKYFAIPGDFSSATRFWNRLNANADCVTNSAASVTTPGACDGNGNSQVLDSGVAGGVNEVFMFWRHLALAGLIEGNYSGLAGAGGQEHSVAGTNVPPSKLSQAGWWTEYLGTFAGNSNIYAGNYGNFFELGAIATNSYAGSPALKPEEAWNVDTKLDDGKPGTGKVVARYWNAACASAASATDYTSTYRLSDSAAQCVLFFVQAY